MCRIIVGVVTTVIIAVVIAFLNFGAGINLDVITKNLSACEALCKINAKTVDEKAFCEKLGDVYSSTSAYVDKHGIDHEESAFCVIAASARKKCGKTLKSAVKEIISYTEKLVALPTLKECMTHSVETIESEDGKIFNTGAVYKNVVNGQAGDQEIWRGLVVEPEDRCSPYDKESQYPYPKSVEDHIVASMNGRIYGPYTGTTFKSDTLTDIEHIVAASEGHDSGLCSASEKIRKEFATDLLNLTLAAPKVNRCGAGGKCGLDAGEWMPEKNACWFANRVVEIKREYGLSVNKDEAADLEAMLSRCTSFDMVFYEPTSVVTKVEVDTSKDPLALYDDNGNGRITCAEARSHRIAPVHSNHPAYKYMHDRDGDGVVCE